MIRINNHVTPRTLLISIAALVVLCASIYYIMSRPNTGSGVIPSTSPKVSSSLSPSKQQASSSTSIPSRVGSATSASSSKSNQPTSAAGEPLKAPSGTFISNHHPGGGNPTAIASVCNTTPGAACYIKFTKGDVVKTLPTETADSNGSAFWNWDVRTAGFTDGSWTIEAISSLNGQTMSTKDPMELVVSS